MKKWKNWAKCAGVRAIRTVAQCAVGMLTGNTVGLMDVDWVAVSSASALAGVLCLLTSVAGLPEIKED